MIHHYIHWYVPSGNLLDDAVFKPLEESAKSIDASNLITYNTLCSNLDIIKKQITSMFGRGSLEARYMDKKSISKPPNYFLGLVEAKNTQIKKRDEANAYNAEINLANDLAGTRVKASVFLMQNGIASSEIESLTPHELIRKASDKKHEILLQEMMRDQPIYKSHENCDGWNYIDPTCKCGLKFFALVRSVGFSFDNPESKLIITNSRW